MEREFTIADRLTLIEKTGGGARINGRPHIEISVRRQVIDRDGRQSGFHLTHRHVPARATWAEIEGHVRNAYQAA